MAILAETLGCSRVWIFDSTPLWEDPFVHLALAAQRTSRVGLGTAVLIPTERSAMAMASAIAAVDRLSDGRFRACFGTGATARRTMGQRPMTLRVLESYVTAVRGLLAGATVTIDGKPARMLHVDGMTATRPVEVEIRLSVFGPRGIQLAGNIADGIIGAPTPHPLPVATLMAGTVLEPGEDADSDRVPEAVDAMPGGQAWREALERLAPPGERHLLTYEGHVTHLTDQLAWLGENVVREVIYTPSGPNVARELKAFVAVCA